VSVVARIVRVREALEDGDIGFAYAIVCDLEEDLAGNDVATSFAAVPEEARASSSAKCPSCSASFRWPGQLDHHERFHHLAEAA
jgi:hypothetical protein